MTNPHDYSLPDPSLDPEARRIAWERDRNERARRHMIASAIQAAREEGIALGREVGLRIAEEVGISLDRKTTVALRIGVAEGVRAGKASVLTRLITHKFGGLTEEQHSIVERANETILDCWIEEALRAKKRDDVFRE
jgi:hypothetical protein